MFFLLLVIECKLIFNVCTHVCVSLKCCILYMHHSVALFVCMCVCGDCAAKGLLCQASARERRDWIPAIPITGKLVN